MDSDCAATMDSEGAAAFDLPSRLRDGVLLGRLLEGLEPGLRLTGFNRKARSRAAAITNLELVLAAVWRRAPLARDMPSAEEVMITIRRQPTTHAVVPPASQP
jgi:hypothetical protein